MLELMSIIVAIGFFLNGLLHVLLVFGYPLGEYVLGGKYIVLPPKMRIVSTMFVIIWTFIGICHLNYGHVIQVESIGNVDRNSIMLGTLFLFFAIFSNAFLTKSKKERWLMTPFCLLMFMLSIIILYV